MNRAVRSLVQHRETLRANVTHRAHTTLVIDPPPNLSGNPSRFLGKDARSPSAARELHDRPRRPGYDRPLPADHQPGEPTATPRHNTSAARPQAALKGRSTSCCSYGMRHRPTRPPGHRCRIRRLSTTLVDPARRSCLGRKRGVSRWLRQAAAKAAPIRSSLATAREVGVRLLAMPGGCGSLAPTPPAASVRQRYRLTVCSVPGDRRGSPTGPGRGRVARGVRRGVSTERRDLQRQLPAPPPARGCALVGGALRAAERLAQPPAEPTRSLAGDPSAGAKRPVDTALRLGRQANCSIPTASCASGDFQPDGESLST